MNLNQNEKKVLSILRENPYISQKDLAEIVKVSRSAVANILSSLQQKGYILGKPYVLREEEYITCVGGANIDVTFKLEEHIRLGTSNPIASSISHGGVIRNIAENLARLDVSVSLMTLVGQDSYGEELISDSNKLMKTFASETIKNERTGSYYSTINPSGEMEVGFADMTINHLMNRSWILEHKRHLLMSSYIVADLNIQVDGIESIIEISRENNIPLAIIGVSSPKMKHLPKDIKGLDLIICNKDESQTYFQTQDDDAKELCKMWLSAGVKKVVVTSGSKGAYYGEKDEVSHQEAFIIPKDQLIDVTGAGDAFSSATILGITHNKSLKESVLWGTANASLTIKTKYAVNPKLSLKLIKKEIEKNEK